MVLYATLPPFEVHQQLLYSYAQAENHIMSRDARDRPSARQPPRGSNASPSPAMSEGRQSPFATSVPEGHSIQQPGSVSVPTHNEPIWAPAPYYGGSFPSPPIHHWPQQYAAGAGVGEELTGVSGYGSGPSTDAESTSGLDELMFQNQMSQFSGPFAENLPLESMHGGPPYLFHPSPRASVHTPTIPSQGHLPTPLIVPSTPMLPLVPQPSPRGSTPVPPTSTAVAPNTEAPKGKKRVRSPSPEDASIFSELAHTMRKRQATESSTNMGPARVRTPQSAGNTSDVRVADPSVRRSATPVPSNQRRRPSQPRSREDARTPGACWRCRRYKKPCNNREGTCDTCLTSGFRIWPASLGCRRGDIQEFVDAIMPDGMEDTIAMLPVNIPGGQTWRSNLEPPMTSMPSDIEGRQQDKWDHLSKKVISTRVFGREFVELFEILASHQREAGRVSGKEHPLLNLVAATLSYSVDLYHRFVAIDGQSQPESRLQTTRENLMDLRASLSNTLSAWLSLCLRGRLADFPIAFLVASLTLCSLIIVSDTVYVLKGLTGEHVWVSSAREHMTTLRSELMTIAVDLLGVVGKGAKPIRFRCFTREPDEPRSAEGMRLMADNAASFDIMTGLQQWIVRHSACFLDDAWAETPPYTLGLVPRPIRSMSRFVQMGYGSVQDI